MTCHRARFRSLMANAAMALLLGFVLLQPVRAQLIPNLGGQRVGISAYQFLKIGVGGRGVAFGESFLAVANDASALYYNPAGLVQFQETEFIASHTAYVMDIKHDFVGAVYHLTPSDAVGLSMTSLATNDMEVTTETQPFGTGRFFRYGDFALGMTYARRMTDQFSFGVTMRYVSETLDVLKMNGLMVDLGTFYWTGIGTSRFVVVISNFGPDVSPSGEAVEYDGTKVSSFQAFAPPTQFKFGFAFDPYKSDEQHATVSLALVHPNDNVENFNLGVEYNWQQWLYLRGGLRRAIGEQLFGKDRTSAGDVTLGLGVAAPLSGVRMSFDYGYVDFNQLGSVHRFSMGLMW